MARNKSSKFGVADDLQYTDNTEKTKEIKETVNTSEITKEDVVQIVEQSRKLLESISHEDAQKVTGKRGRPPKAENEKLRGYRYNLNLDRDLKEYLHEMAWENRTSITQYINDLIRGDMENNEKWKK